MASNVQTQQFFAPQKKELSEDVFGGFDQADKALSVSTMMRNNALQKIKELQTKRAQEEADRMQSEGQITDNPNKDWATRFREMGMQGEVDKAGSPEAFNRVFQEYAQKAQGTVQNAGESMSRAVQGAILGAKGTITQAFGNRSGVEKYSGGVNYGTDIAVPRGTPVAAPPIGEWEVVEAFNGASKEGPGNSQNGINRGYGNSVLIQNTKTGEKLRYSHLRVGGVGVQPGQVVPGGTPLGQTGSSGNTAGRTGQHLDLEYYGSNGRVANVLRSQYGRYLQ